MHNAVKVEPNVKLVNLRHELKLHYVPQIINPNIGLFKSGILDIL